MTVHYERLCDHAGILRVYLGGGSYETRSPYTYAIVVKALSSELAMLKGLVSERLRLGLVERREISECLQEQGFTKVTWKRADGRSLTFDTVRL
jgi:hypothetical protein